MNSNEFSAIDEEEIVDEWSSTDPGIRTYLTKKGYKFLGKGVDQQAYLEPGTGYVLKIFGTQDSTKTFSKTPTLQNIIHSPDHKMFFTWAGFCQKNQNNPFLPRFFGFSPFIFKSHTYIQIHQERLKPAGKIGYRAEELKEYAVESVTYHESQKTALDSFISEIPDNLLTKLLRYEDLLLLTKTIASLFRISEKRGWNFDLHDGNFMLRGTNTPVIIDPWVVYPPFSKPPMS